MVPLLMPPQIPPPAWELPWRPGEFRGELPRLPRLGTPTPAGRRSEQPGEATVEVIAPVLTEEVGALRQLRLDLTLQAREMFALAGTTSLEGRAMLALFSSLNASNIHGLADGQTRAMQNLFNPPRIRATWGPLSLSATPERPR